MRTELSSKIQHFIYSNKFLWIIICVGILLRLIRYLHNPSLGFDEAAIAGDIITRPFSELFYPSPTIEQTSPYGFVILVKLFSQLFGNSEYSLRLYPFLSGSVSMFLFYKVAKQYIKPSAVPFALGLFALSDPLIYYSADVKTYSCDVAITLLLFAAAWFIQANKVTTIKSILFGLAGAVAIWFSHPAAFVLAGVGIVLTVTSVYRKDWGRLGRLGSACVIWAASFLSCYVFFTSKLISSFGNTLVFMDNNNAIMPLPPTNLKDIQWYINTFFNIFNYPAGITLTGIAAMAFLVGGTIMYIEKREKFFILMLPAVFAFLASSIHMYAIQGRIILFLVPSILLVLAEGLEYIREKTNPSSALIGTSIIILLFFHPLMWSTYHATKPDSREEIKPVLQHIKENWQKGDMLYVYYMSINAFEYYSNLHPGNYSFNDNEIIIGRAPRDWYATYRKKEFAGFWNKDKPFAQPYTEIFKEYTEELNKLKGHKRIWILFSSNVPKAGINEEKFYVYHLETIGEKLDFFGRAGISAVYLYDLS